MCARPGRTCGAPVLAGVAGTRGENVTAAGRTTLPAIDGTTTQRECMCGALVRCHDPRGVHHRRAEALEPFGESPSPPTPDRIRTHGRPCWDRRLDSERARSGCAPRLRRSRTRGARACSCGREAPNDGVPGPQAGQRAGVGAAGSRHPASRQAFQAERGRDRCMTAFADLVGADRQRLLERFGRTCRPRPPMRGRGILASPMSQPRCTARPRHHQGEDDRVSAGREMVHAARRLTPRRGPGGDQLVQLCSPGRAIGACPRRIASRQRAPVYAPVCPARGCIPVTPPWSRRRARPAPEAP